jgi:molybdate transport system regulatory protein
MKRAAALGVQAELELHRGGQSIAGARRVQLLAEIDRAGSLTHAARAVGLSYKGAWDAIEQMTNLAGAPLVERTVGGKGGGRTALTARGQQLVRNFTLLQAEHARFVERLNRRAVDLAGDRALMENLAMQTSARNQFAGLVKRVRVGAVNDEVVLEVIGGLRIVATVTAASRKSLGLKLGTPAFALVKASSVMLMTGGDAVRLSARNQLTGTVARVSRGAVNSEVVLELPGGGAIAAIVTVPSVASLGLAAGGQATALFKASSVIVGVSA